MSTREQDAAKVEAAAQAIYAARTPGERERAVARHAQLLAAYTEAWVDVSRPEGRIGSGGGSGPQVRLPWRPYSTSVPSVTLRD